MRTQLLILIVAASAISVSGCMHPGMHYGAPYSQPMYAPPSNLSQPGTLYVPPSNAPPYDPLNNPSTYDEPTDSWRTPGNSTDSRFFGDESDEDPVPNPVDAGGSSAPFDSDFNSGT